MGQIRGKRAYRTNRCDDGKSSLWVLDMDDPITVELEFPRDLLGALQTTESELESELKRLIALELFREERISSGTAAKLPGVSKVKFVPKFKVKNNFHESRSERGI